MVGIRGGRRRLIMGEVWEVGERVDGWMAGLIARGPLGCCSSLERRDVALDGGICCDGFEDEEMRFSEYETNLRDCLLHSR